MATKAKKSSTTSKPGSGTQRSTSAGSSQKQGSTQQKGSGMLEEFILDQLKDMYWAEKHLLKALPKMQKNATTDELKKAFKEHLTVTAGQVGRLEQVFEMMGKKAQGKKCEAMEGLSKEADSIIAETEKGTMTRDAALIIAAQKVEHYEIATYGGLVQLANVAGYKEVAELLQQTLNEEKETDQLLTQIAENNINWEAEQEDAEEGEGEEEENAKPGKKEF